MNLKLHKRVSFVIIILCIARKLTNTIKSNLYKIAHYAELIMQNLYIFQRNFLIIIFLSKLFQMLF